MPDHVLTTDHGRHALTMLRLALLGLAEIERGREGEATEQDIADARALATTNITDSIRLLDLYLTASIQKRDNDVNQIVDLVHHDIPWRARLSNPAGTVVKLHKPSQEDVKRNRNCVTLDPDSPIDDDVKDRWRKIDKASRPDVELKPLADEITSLMRGQGLKPRPKPEDT